MNSRLISLNGNAGAFVDILATLPVTRVRMREDDAAAATGVQIKSLMDAFATTNVYAATSEPIEIPPTQAVSGRRGAVLGFSAQGQAGAFNFRAADKLVSARGNAAGVTTLRFEEYE
jgi:hypothetical protein